LMYDSGMNKYYVSVELVVEVEAFNHLDAEDAVRDALGIGDAMGVNIIESTVGDVNVA
jgi:hypothetical protein